MSIDKFRNEHYFLSNMSPLPVGIVTPDGITVYTSEHLYQSAKLVRAASRRMVQEAVNGYAARQTLRSLVEKGESIRGDWNEVRVGIMRASVCAKFITNPGFAAKLLDTDGELVEGNTWGDTFWGVSPPPPHGLGQNMLGQILMETRDLLRCPDFSIDIDTLVRRIFTQQEITAGIDGLTPDGNQI